MKSPLPPSTAPATSHSVTIVASAHNEAANLKPLLAAIAKTIESLGFELPVLIINDGSTDESAAILDGLQSCYPFLKVIHHEHRSGLTECLKTAIQQTDTDWLYLSPADLESDPRTDLPRLLDGYRPGTDAVAGWRQGRKDGKTTASRLANLACRLLFGLQVHDMNWIKLVRRDALARLPIDQISYAYVLPVMSAMGDRITEVPTPWHHRTQGKSKFGSGRLLSSAVKFWRLWWWFYVTEKSSQQSQQQG